MASACVNNITVPPENFLDCPPSVFPAYGWMSPRISVGREHSGTDSKHFAGAKPEKKLPEAPEASDPAKDHGEFEFRLDDPVAMLPADELFSDGKLVPLQLTVARPAATEGVSSPEARKSCSRSEMLSGIAGDPYLQSPKAPRCSVRWRELLGFKKTKQEMNDKSKATSASTASFSTSSNSSSPNTGKSIRQFLYRTSKSMSCEAPVNLPMFKDSDCESSHSISSSRLSLSSSSSGYDHDDLPRLSLDADNKLSGHSHISLSRCSSSGPNQSLRHHRVRTAKPRMVPATVAEDPEPSISRAISADSPRMSSSGKIVFQSLGRSSSSPSSFNGGPRYRHRGVERSYSANVRITPVLNVPVCSLRGSFGLGQIFSSQSQKKESNGGAGSTKKSLHHRPHCNSRPRRESS